MRSEEAIEVGVPGVRRYLARPELLRQELESDPPQGRQIVIDEIQKVPSLLDEVHWLIENRGLHFALCGSSARKVKRGAANLLGGRAMRNELHGLSAAELGRDFDLDRMINHGVLPRIYQASRPRRMLDAYVADYLKEEVAAEGLVRNLPTFSDFLDAAALSDGEMVNFSNIARKWDHPRVGRRIVVCREPRARRTDDGIESPLSTWPRPSMLASSLPCCSGSARSERRPC